MKDVKQNETTNMVYKDVALSSSLMSEEKRKAMEERIEKEWKPRNVFYPEYWRKRQKKLNPELKKMLAKTANRKPIACDEYDFYAPGHYLHRSFIVTVKYEDDMWSLHIYGEQAVTLPIIEEVRYKFLPDNIIMAQLWLKRSERNALQGVVLYEIPSL